MPIKITKKSKKTKKGKGKVSQSQQVIVNIQKGKRKALSQPVSRPSQPPIIIQPPQQDFTQLENLFKQYSTSRSVAEPKPVTMGMETQTSVGIPANLEENIRLEQQKLKEKLASIQEEKPVKNLDQDFLNLSQLRSAIDTDRVGLRRGKKPEETPVRVIKPRTQKTGVRRVLNPSTNRLIDVGGTTWKTLVREGKIQEPEDLVTEISPKKK